MQKAVVSSSLDTFKIALVETAGAIGLWAVYTILNRFVVQDQPPAMATSAPVRVTESG